MVKENLNKENQGKNKSVKKIKKEETLLQESNPENKMDEDEKDHAHNHRLSELGHSTPENIETDDLK
jgi:hypothetical protein